MKQTITYALLGLSSAILLSLGFLVPHCGLFSLIGFVPLLWMDKLADEHKTKHFFWWYYATFVLFNVFTTFWVCFATLIGGIVANLFNALFMSMGWALFRFFKHSFSRKHHTVRRTGPLPYIFLAVAWIAWERLYFAVDISWPWLTLGNSFARTTSLVQWYEITGTLGGSLWVWCCNLAIFGLLAAIRDGRWKSKFTNKARWAAIAATIILFVAPITASLVRYCSIETEDLTTSDDNKTLPQYLKVCALQPNMDPYLKFVSMSQDAQNDITIDLIRQGYDGDGKPVLFLAPESLANDMVLNDVSYSPTLKKFRGEMATMPDANMIYGSSTYNFIHSPFAPSYTARPRGQNEWYEDYNSAVAIDGSDKFEIYHKSCLVVGTERMPYPKYFSKLERLLGGNIMGHCIGQDKVSLLHFIYSDSTALTQSKLVQNSVPLGCAICYESIYPEYYAGYVKAGAKAMTIITNDAWWGDTPGYRQHLSYARLRAIETRRDIVRSANTGISAIINSRGDIVAKTGWWERTTLKGYVSLKSELTPFVKYGDVCGRLCTFIFFLLCLALPVQRFYSR